MRVATSTEIKDYHLGIVQQVLRKVSDKHRARLLAIPISQTADERDQEFIHQLLGRNNYLGKIQWRFQTPLEVIKRVGGCHVMVTGAYHGAVFALAQGIPAVCLAKSEHYMNKFSGLADQFKVGCQVIDMNENRLQEKLESAIDDAWDSAEEIRPQLLAAAKLQIEQGKAAYQLIYDMVESKKYSTLSMGVE